MALVVAVLVGVLVVVLVFVLAVRRLHGRALVDGLRSGRGRAPEVDELSAKRLLGLVERRQAEGNRGLLLRRRAGGLPELDCPAEREQSGNRSRGEQDDEREEVLAGHRDPSFRVDAPTVRAPAPEAPRHEVNHLQDEVRIRVSTEAGAGRGCDDLDVNILLVEDEDAIAAPLAEGLRREGFDVERVSTGTAALAAQLPDLVLLDLRLPDMDGTEVCQRLRARSEVPIIVVTAKGEEVDRVVGLELGADDYVVKPFGFRELLARIRAVLRRTQRGTPNTRLVAGSLEIDLRSRRVALDGSELELTPKEFDLLALLASDPGAVVSREHVLREVWKTDWFGPTKTVDVHVASLRRKLGDPRWIETVRGVGLRLAPQS